MNTKNKTIAVLMAAIIVSAAVAVPMAMAVVPNAEVPTQAVLGGGNSAPYICAKFETPDHSIADGTQISPIAGGDRRVNFYVVTGHPSDVSKIVRVDVTVFKPISGDEKYQLVALNTTGIWTAEKCYPNGTCHPVQVRQVFWGDRIDMNADGDTVDTGDLILEDALTQLTGENRVAYGLVGIFQYGLTSVLHDLENSKQIMLEIEGEMGYHQVSGFYKVEAKSTDILSNTGDPLVNFFEYLSIVSLAIDFNGVNWGNITGGETSYKYGDANMSTPSKPTVRNMGNDPAMIGLNYTKMTSGTKTIEDFDGKLNGGAVTACPAETLTVLKSGTGTNQLLPACTPTQIDFSIHPGAALAGTYTGSVDIRIDHYV